MLSIGGHWLVFGKTCLILITKSRKYRKIGSPRSPVPICRWAIRDASDEHQNFHFFHTFSSFLVQLMKSVVVRWCQKCDEMHDLVKVPRQDGGKMQNLLRSARFTLNKYDFTLKLLKFYTLSSILTKKYFNYWY